MHYYMMGNEEEENAAVFWEYYCIGLHYWLTNKVEL